MASNIYSKSINDYYLLLSQQRLSLQKQMRTGVQIDHFINDSIGFAGAKIIRRIFGFAHNI